MSEENRETPPPTTSRPPSRTPSPCLSLSPLWSPIDSGSHAEWMEAQLLSDMAPEDKWKVAVAHAPKIPRRSPTTSEPDGAVASTSSAPDGPAPANCQAVVNPTTGESEEILESLLDEFEPSGEVEGGERKWGETLSHQAVEELTQWLQQSGDHSGSPPPPTGREPGNRNLPSLAPKVEPPLGSSPRGTPQHIRAQKESEARFQLLPIIAIEPFPEGDMEWDDDGATPSPLRPVESWPRLRGRRQKFNPRRVECQGEAPPSSLISAPDGEDRHARRRTGSNTPQVPVGASSGEPATPVVAEAQPEPRDQRPSVFSRLGRTRSPTNRRSPDRFPDLRNCPERGMLFGGLRPIPRDKLDPAPGACFNCRRKGHSRAACGEPQNVYCYNCGRKGTTLLACPRCGEAHREHLRRQGSARIGGSSSSGSQRSPPRRRRDAPHPPSALGASRTSRRDQPGASTDSRPGPSTATPPRPTPPAPSPARAVAANPGESTIETAPAARPTLVEYFASISHLAGDLQEVLLRAFLAQGP